jgi:phosphoribosylanthranilate isomerase
MAQSLPFQLQNRADPQIKICGLSTADTVAAAVDAGADLIGFVSFARSPRHVAMADAAALAAPARGRADIVLLVVDATDAELTEAVAILNPDVLQVHGAEAPDRVAALRARFGVPVIKAIKVATRADVQSALAFRSVADLVLFDAKAPKTLDGALPGGNGLSFDWQLLDGWPSGEPYMLSGGLNADTIGAAVAQTKAPFVDVSSGVESTPGIKSVRLIQDFIAAVRAVPQSLQK